MKIKLTLTLLISLVMVGCGKKPVEIKPDNKLLLAQSLYLKDFNSAQKQMTTMKLSENSQNLIKANQIIQQGSELNLQRELNYLQQFYPQMNAVHQEVYMQMHKWLLLKQIYRTEISPPVRILQREELYLAPSNINFNPCQTTSTRCAKEQRLQLIKLISEQEITDALRKMARKDPCANLSNRLKDNTFANRCLKSSKGGLHIELLAKPLLTQAKWLEVIANE